MENQIALTNHEMAASATAAQARAEIECAYAMAFRKPRNIDDVRVKVLKACQRPVFAECVEYSKPMGKENGKQKYITGPSIRFVETALQLMGNVRTTTTAIYEDDKLRKIHVSVTDLENNSNYGGDVVIQKTVERKFLKKDQKAISERTNSYGDKVYLVEATEDDVTVKQNAMISKLIRTLGGRLIPRDITEEAMDVAAETRKTGMKDPEAAKRKIFDGFSTLGIKPSEIEQFMGKKADQILPKDIDELRKVYTSIKEGHSVWSDYLETAEPDPDDTPKSLKDKMKAAKEKGKPKDEKPAELTDAQKIFAGLDEALRAKVYVKSGYDPDFSKWDDKKCSNAMNYADIILDQEKIENERGL